MVHLSRPGAELELPALPTVVYVVVHPVDTSAHPSYPPGFRWAVMLGPCPPSQVGNAANAGWCPNEYEARTEGEQNANSVLGAFAVIGFNIRPAPNVLVLDHDPIPAGADPVRVL